MYDIKFEHCFIEKVLELVSQQGIFATKIALAKAIWPEMSERSANTTLNDIINQNSKGKKRNLRLHEAVRMAQIVKKPFPSLCFEVEETLKLRENIDLQADTRDTSSSTTKKNQKSIPKETSHFYLGRANQPESKQ